MKETNSQGKSCVMPAALIAGLGMAGMGLVSSGVVVADTTSVTDTINVTVQPSCTFNSVQDKTYVGSAANGTEVDNFNEAGVHEFNIFCNDHNGFIVTATPYDLEADGITDVIAYTDDYTHTGVNSMWTAEIVTDNPALSVTSPVPIGGGTIVTSDTSTVTAGVDFTATYKAYVGTATPAGTYTGRIEYTLTAASTSNGGTSNSGNGGQNDDSGQNENGGENGENGGEGGSGTGGTGGSENPDNTNSANNTPSNAPVNLTNTYNTYNTTNSYSTTNYSGGITGVASTPALASTQGSTSGTTSGTTSGNSGSTTDSKSGSSNTGASSSYEQPLGVTNTTSSQNQDSGFDPMPIVAAGALAVAGVAAVALARNKQED